MKQMVNNFSDLILFFFLAGECSIQESEVRRGFNQQEIVR